MLHHTAWRAGLLAATVFAGMLLGGLLVGCLGDWWGRRPMLLTGLTLNATAGLVSAASWNVYALAAARLVAGVGIGATVPPLFCLCSELAPPSARGFWVTAAASFWMVGSVYVAVVGWWLLSGDSGSSGGDGNANDSAHVASWRVFVAACALPSCLGCLLVHRCVPESPRFLLLQGRHDAALAVTQRLADALNYNGPALTRQELLHHYPLPDNVAAPTATVGGAAAASNHHHSNNHNDNHQSNNDGLMLAPAATTNDDYTSLSSSSTQLSLRSRRRPHLLSELSSIFRTAIYDFTISASLLYTPQLRSTTYPLQMVWFTLSFGSYGLLTWINTLFVRVHLENVYLNALLFAASNLPGNLMSAYLMDKTGRKSLLTGSILAASLSLVSFAYVAAEGVEDNSGSDEATTISESATVWIVGSACAFQCFTIAAWNAIDVLTSELFPTSVRSTGMGVCAATGRGELDCLFLTVVFA